MRKKLAVALAAALVLLPQFAAEAATGRNVSADAAMYPRAIRLAHSGSANGRVIATMTQFPAGGPAGGIYESVSDGGGFQRVGTVADPDARQGLCCTSLFELPQAVGGLGAGTLLWAGAVGQDGGDGRRMSIKLWASTDVGRSWRSLATVARSGNSGGLWEPELYVDSAGRLVTLFADESQPGRSQVLVQSTSADGVNWSARTPIVTGPQSGNRPGMPAVERLADGRWLLAYEVCGFGGQYDCAVRSRTSTDGTSWGDPARLDPVVTAGDGRYLTATPTLATTATGRVLLIGQRVRNADGTDSAVNERAMLASADNGRSWTVTATPVAVPGARSAVCPNYSPVVVPTADGTGVLQVTTDDTGSGCHAVYAEGLLAPAAAVAGRFTTGGGACVDVAAGGGANGAAVQTWQCNDAPVQRWTLRPDGSVAAQNRCLDVPGAATAAGTPLQIWDCNGGPAQQWLRRVDGALLNPNSGRCVDAPNGQTANGTRLRLWDCNGAAAQRFPFTTSTGLSVGSTVTLRVTTAGFTDRYLRRQNDLAVTSVLTSASAEPDRQDAAFVVRAGLANASCLSLQSVATNGFLRHRNYALRLDAADGSALFNADATFCPETVANGVKLRSYNFPDRYVRHYNATGYIASPSGPNAFDAPGNFDADVTWRVEGAL
ncbi:AbfB domain-containing protein [Dactylosporangium sp. NPDC000244]|uniref:AbfB domain-containing protein n=1 Tax=Dactylosporangium sp. NPDC000244 TaxID=3154365 RepID=UPI0033180230